MPAESEKSSGEVHDVAEDEASSQVMSFFIQIDVIVDSFV